MGRDISASLGRCCKPVLSDALKKRVFAIIKASLHLCLVNVCQQASISDQEVFRSSAMASGRGNRKNCVLRYAALSREAFKGMYCVLASLRFIVSGWQSMTIRFAAEEKGRRK